MTIFLALATLFVLLNLHIGFVLMKRRGKWHFGIVNWGVALYLSITIVDNINKFIQ